MKTSEAEVLNQLEQPEPNEFFAINNILVFPRQNNTTEVPSRSFTKREFSVTDPTAPNSIQPKYRVLG